MPDVIDFDARPWPRWQFVNLFYDATKLVYHCRLRLMQPGKITDAPEVTGAGATATIAMHNAKQLAGKHNNA